MITMQPLFAKDNRLRTRTCWLYTREAIQLAVGRAGGDGTVVNLNIAVQQPFSMRLTGSPRSLTAREDIRTPGCLASCSRW
jgi:hypothetical protein